MSKSLKEGLLIFEGTVQEILGGGLYKVQLLENNFITFAYLSGKIKKNKIKILIGDLVKLEVSAADITKGRIVLRK